MSRRGAQGAYGELLDVMLAAARDAAAVIRDGALRRGTLQWEAKGPADFVTAVDRGAEERIRERLLGSVPDAQLLAEETWTGETPGTGLCFVVDPLDGTTNFLHGVLEYAVSIGALEDGVPVAGVVLNAARGDLFTATRGGGAFRDGERVEVSRIADPSRALIATGFPFRAMHVLERYVAQFKAVSRQTSGIRRAGAAALDFATLASGCYEAFWELQLAPWDVAAGMLLLREAGGVVTDLDGNEAVVKPGGFVGGSPAMHEWLLRTLHEADAESGAAEAAQEECR